MSLYVQAIVNGFLVGGVYSLMALGLSLIFGVMRVINFAHGDMMVWGMYLSYWLFVTAGVDPYLSILVTGSAVFLLGAAVQKGLVNRILDAPHEMQILLMLGVALVLENVALMVWGPDPRRVSTTYALSTFWLGPIVFDLPKVATFGLALALALGLYLFLKKTDLGRMIRAASDNQIGALLVGTDILKVFTLAFGIGAACVGAAGSLMTPFLPFSPSTGLFFTVTSFNIVIIGGMGSFLGAFVGGLLVGMSESLGAVILVPSLKEIVSFVLLVLILLFRPQGLLGSGR
ncbi:MAG: branched-chain amino acid ABC transporter permease [candidate division NC10 bacterium]|nr:branched-chain amino acid ABC transporter permease [candidate division NC10 bacterium]MBI2116319.1 branched-chain amino acid ABC transporter permease [candidate division NC10 bacterium]MBI2455885.1 branched-chain amino acid ABC transporter permease [candidate division NC10 bacterium]MBI2917535.1 branched-chain amino acid ABC transporter permease [Chloroflexota bacterium]